MTDSLNEDTSKEEERRLAYNARSKVHYHKDVAKSRAIQKKSRESRKDKLRIKSKRYREENQSSVLEQNKAYIKRRKESDESFKISRDFRVKLYKAIKRNQKTGTIVADIGCSIYELKKHIESLFYPNHETMELMTWDNWGRSGWHLDHIRPLRSFDLTNREQYLEAVHYSNTQPMWAKDHDNKSITDRAKND